jgi:DNA-binding NarL/FixJ family response regulator
MACVVRVVHQLSSTATNIIVLAPYADAVERELLLNAGAKRYLLKHINSDQLIQEIEAVVAGMPGGD